MVDIMMIILLKIKSLVNRSLIGNNMTKYKTIIFLIIIFILQTINVIWSYHNPNIGEGATIFAIFCDGIIFGNLINIILMKLEK